MRTSTLCTAFLLGITILALCATPTLAGKGGKGGGNGGGGGSEPPADPAIARSHRGEFDLMELEVMNADGTNRRIVIAGLTRLSRPSWSPDASQLAFVSTISGNGVYVIDVDGSGLRKVTTISGDVSGAQVAWSPMAAADGKAKLAFVDTAEGASSQDIFLVNLDGTDRVNLTDSPGFNEGPPSWSPTADAIAVAIGLAGGRKKDVAVLTLGLVSGAVDVIAVTNLTDDVGVPGGAINDAWGVGAPDWGKTGDRIAVVVDLTLGGEYPDIWVIDLADPANPTQITNTPRVEERRASWSEDDSKFIGYAWSTSRKTRGIQILASDGSGTPELLFKNEGGTVAWRRQQPQ